MPDVVGTWRLVKEVRFDASGRPLPTRFGEQGIGLVRFDGQRMMAVLVDNSPALPAEGERAFNSYCGAYTFDGQRLVTRVDAGLPALIGSDQVRKVRWEGERLVLTPPSIGGAAGETRELTWERVA